MFFFAEHSVGTVDMSFELMWCLAPNRTGTTSAPRYLRAELALER